MRKNRPMECASDASSTRLGFESGRVNVNRMVCGSADFSDLSRDICKRHQQERAKPYAAQ